MEKMSKRREIVLKPEVKLSKSALNDEVFHFFEKNEKFDIP